MGLWSVFLMGAFIYNIVIYPLELLVELIYVFFLKSFDNSGIAIAGISIVVSLLALPLYNIADSLQRKERDVRIQLKPGIDRIKAVFKGDEQYMILSTFYRQNHYHPAYALRSSISLMIQVPFFIAAYHFLSHLPQLQGQSFFFISDLGQPDRLLTIGGISFNVLPILMTVINVIAGIIYSKGFPLRDKVQLYGMAGLFMVLLYNSPAGLVYYWTLNNIFSLVKNCFYRLKNPLKALYGCAVFASIGITIAISIAHPSLSFANRIVLIGGCIAILVIPLFLRFVDFIYRMVLSDFSEDRKQRNLLFILSSLILWALCGFLIPSNLISSSTIEFSFLGNVENPLYYVYATATIFFGVCFAWPLAIYALASKKVKTIFAYLFSSLSLLSLLNVFLFKGNYGTVSTHLEFENPTLLTPSSFLLAIPFIVGLACFFLCGILIQKRGHKVLSGLFLILSITTLVASMLNIMTIQNEFTEHKQNVLENQAKESDVEGLKPVFHLSKEGKNVVVLFLDRAINAYFPYALEQIPDLKDQLDGFVYYPNTVSFGTDTLYGAPAMMGGYEYTPGEINKRGDEKLVDKHNEATLVLPKLFLDAGYSVTVTDPPFCNYKWEGDYTPFKPYPEIKVMNILGKFAVQYKKEFSDVLYWDTNAESTIIMNRLPMFSLMKVLPPLLRKTIYDTGRYFLVDENSQDIDIFLNSYSTLYYLDSITDYTAEGNTYTFIDNQTTHSPVFLQAPEYEPRSTVTDIATPFDELAKLSEKDIGTYHVYVAALKRIGIWLEQLKKDGMYDNTRIFIVADHGKDLFNPLFMDFDNTLNDYSRYNPLLLVKDFDAKDELRTDHAFMTNADLPQLAIENLEVSKMNPFTGKNLLESVQKQKVQVYTGSWDPKKNLGTQFAFDYSRSFTVHDDISIETNWGPIVK